MSMERMHRYILLSVWVCAYKYIVHLGHVNCVLRFWTELPNEAFMCSISPLRVVWSLPPCLTWFINDNNDNFGTSWLSQPIVFATTYQTLVDFQNKRCNQLFVSFVEQCFAMFSFTYILVLLTFLALCYQ